MTKFINLFLCIAKMFLLLTCFVLTFYVVINDYRRLELNLFSSINNFIPYFILFILFSINFILRQKKVNGCLFYNVTCVLVFTLILFVLYRTLFDDNMLYYGELGYDMNFYYFNSVRVPFKIMLYCLSISNLIFMFNIDTFNKIINSKKDEK